MIFTRVCRVVLVLYICLVTTSQSSVALAQETTYSGEGSISLVASCEIRFEQDGSDFSFGSWQWDGQRYRAGSDAVSDRIEFSLVIPNHLQSCALTVSSPGFWFEGTERIIVGSEYLAVYFRSSPEATQLEWMRFDGGSVTIQVDSRDRDLAIGLMGVPVTVAPGTFRTSFTFEISDGTNAP